MHHKYIPESTAAETSPVGHSCSLDPTSWGPKPWKPRPWHWLLCLQLLSWRLWFLQSVCILWEVYSLAGNPVKKSEICGKVQFSHFIKAAFCAVDADDYRKSELTRGHIYITNPRLREHWGKGGGQMVRARGSGSPLHPWSLGVLNKTWTITPSVDMPTWMEEISQGSAFKGRAMGSRWLLREGEAPFLSDKPT